jgi:molecular chaperone DnaK (HSP70)
MFYKHLYDTTKDLLSLKQDATLMAVITVPAYFNDGQKKMVLGCAKHAGFDVLRVLSEPSAACFAYQRKSLLPQGDHEVIVVDCGGGTTDVSIICIDTDNGIMETKSIYGNNTLGGEDLTNNLLQYALSKMNLDLDDKLTRRVREECDRVKKELSFSLQSTIYMEERNVKIAISRSLFLEINKQFFIQMREILSDAYSHSTATDFILIGGTTRIPHFANICNDIRKNTCKDTYDVMLDPDTTVSIGASLQGQLLTKATTTSAPEFISIEVLPLSLGVSANGGIMVPIIARNTSYPVSKTRTFLNDDDFPESIDIEVYQGEHRFVKNNYFVSKIQLQHPRFHMLRKGQVKVDVTFAVDANGLLHVSAKFLDQESTDSVLEIVRIDQSEALVHLMIANESKWES